MKLEERFSETLRTLVGERTSPKDARATFEKRLKRTRRLRLAALLSGASVFIAAAAIAVPLLSSDGPVITQTSQSPSADSYAGWHVFQGAAEDRFRVKYPPGWVVSQLGGAFERKSYEILPPGFPTKDAVSRTYAVSISVFPEGLDPGRPESIPSRASKRADGRPFLRSESQSKGHEVTYRIAWSPPCAFQEPGCAIGQSTLVARIFASDAELWEEFRANGEDIVRSIEWA